MDTPKPLPPTSLRRTCDPSTLDFADTSQLSPLEEPLGQDRAFEAIQFAAGIQREGFNVYALGLDGIGKLDSIRDYLERRAKQEPAPSDWCYVNNFAEPRKPEALRLPAGRGEQLRSDMDALIEELKAAIPAAFESDEYRGRKQALDNEFEERPEKAMQELGERVQKKNMSLVRTPMGYALGLVRDGQVLDAEAFRKLPAEEQKQAEADVQAFEKELQKILQMFPKWEKEHRERLRELNREVARYAVGHLIEDITARYADLPEVLEYLGAVHADVLENAHQFMQTKQGKTKAPFMIASDSEGEDTFQRYNVNLIVNHADSEGAPVVYEDHPTHPLLMGRAEHISRFGNLTTNFTLIRSGAVHNANGGYLILDARKVLMQPFAYDSLKRALRMGEIRVESPADLFSFVSTVSLEPEPIPLNVKVILIGDPRLYYLLNQLDPEFTELVKVPADFDERLDRTGDTTARYARLIAQIIGTHKLRTLDVAGVARVIDEASRWVSDNDKLSINLSWLEDLLLESDHWAKDAGRDRIEKEDVERSIAASIRRADRLRERVYEEINRGNVLLETTGRTIGQVNGLSVIQLGRFAFGRPSRITARVRLGRGEVIDIEREVEMGGPIHSKGVMILTGFLGGRFGRKRPLSLAASLVFEQSYAGVEGDSASSAELYALLSALADVPIKQSLAVTGSVNQHGEVQAVGGINEKIEGFFDVCRERGLTGDQGVLIPEANVKHLMLRPDVVEAAEDGKFHIYPVSHIDRGLELLTDQSTGERLPSGEFPDDSINHAIEARLEELAATARSFAVPSKVEQTNGPTE